MKKPDDIRLVLLNIPNVVHGKWMYIRLLNPLYDYDRLSIYCNHIKKELLIKAHTIDKIDRYMSKYGYDMSNDITDDTILCNIGYNYYNSPDLKNMIKYYECAASKDNVEAIQILGYHYSITYKPRESIKKYKQGFYLGDKLSYTNYLKFYENKNKQKYVKLLKYLIKNFNVHEAMNKLGIFYFNKSNYPNAIYYFKKSIQEGNVVAMNNLGRLYDKYKVQDNIPFMKKYYLMGIEHGSDDCMYNLATYYTTLFKKTQFTYKLYIDINSFIYKEIVKYFTMSIELGNTYARDSTYNLGSFYLSIIDCIRHKDYFKTECKKYLKIGILNNDYRCMTKMGLYYKFMYSEPHQTTSFKCENKEKMIHYFKMAVQHGSVVSCGILSSHITKCEFYRVLSTAKELSAEVTNLLNKFSQDKDIIKYVSKISEAKKLDIVNTCNICLDDNYIINMDCGHKICVDCYDHEQKCYFKWCKG